VQKDVYKPPYDEIWTHSWHFVIGCVAIHITWYANPIEIKNTK